MTSTILNHSMNFWIVMAVIVLIGDFNSQDRETCMHTFLYHYILASIVKEGAYFKNSSKHPTIDLF